VLFTSNIIALKCKESIENNNITPRNNKLYYKVLSKRVYS